MTSPTGSRRKAPRGARDFLRRDSRNTRIHIPAVDFNDVVVGAKTEFRNYGKRLFDGLSFPTPAIGYRARDWWAPENALDGIDTVLLTLVDSWVEPLGAISQESIVAEGFEDIGEFRRYFTERYPRGGFRPLANVIVYRLHPMTQDEIDDFAAAHWMKMYGQFA